MLVLEPELNGCTAFQEAACVQNTPAAQQMCQLKVNQVFAMELI